MRTTPILACLLLLLPLVGCFSQDGSESTAPAPPTANGSTDTPLGHTSTGCTGNQSVGAGNGDIGSDHACNSTAQPSLNTSS